MKRRSFLGGLLAALAVPVEALGRVATQYYVPLSLMPCDPYEPTTGARKDVFFSETSSKFTHCFLSNGMMLRTNDDGEWELIT